MTQTLKPFNLERALAGDPVVARNGKKVIEFSYLKSDADYPFIYVLENRERYPYVATKQGKFYNTGCESEFDLFMDQKKKTLYVGIYKLGSRDFESTSVYESKCEVHQIISKRQKKLVKLLQFELEE